MRRQHAYRVGPADVAVSTGCILVERQSGRSSRDMVAGECANIGSLQRRLRRVIAVWAFACAAGVALALMAAGAPRPWRLMVFVPLWVGVLASLESNARTCVLLAAKGLRNMDDGNQRVVDPGELKQLMRQSRRVHVRALFISAALMAVLYMV